MNQTHEQYEQERRALLAEIERDRAALHEAVQQIENAARSTLDVRRRIAEKPWHFVGGAFAIGLLLGLS